METSPGVVHPKCFLVDLRVMFFIVLQNQWQPLVHIKSCNYIIAKVTQMTSKLYTIGKNFEKNVPSLTSDKFWKYPIHYKLLEPIGIEFCAKHNLHLSVSHVPKLQVMYAVTMGLITFSHKLFRTKYGDANQLAEIANMVRVRLNLPNPFTMDLDWECDLTRCPNLQNPGPGWIIITLDQWHQRNDGTFLVVLRNLPECNKFALTDMGKYTQTVSADTNVHSSIPVSVVDSLILLHFRI